MNEAQLAGITPYVLRLAVYYAALGTGEYKPKGYSSFDRVVVRELLPWHPQVQTLILVVEFFRGETRERFVEFSLTVAGFGGKPVVTLLPGGKSEVPEKDPSKD